MIIIAKDQLTCVNGFLYIAEASDLGWAVGYWPVRVAIEGQPRIHLERARIEPNRTLYTSPYGYTLSVIND